MVALQTESGLRSWTAELLSDSVGEEAAGGHRPERAGGLSEGVAGLALLRHHLKRPNR
jgi:hypothetical protein